MTVKLSEFIESSLLEIKVGVENARKKGLVIAPEVTESPLGSVSGSAPVVKFEVEVSTGKSAKGGVSVVNVVDLGADASSNRTQKLTFEVPVYFWAEWKGK